MDVSDERTLVEGDTVEFVDAYTHELKYGRLDLVSGGDCIIRLITKDEAGPNPRKLSAKPDERIAALTNGTGII